MPRAISIATSLAAIILAAPAQAGDAKTLTYPEFEESIVHMDLEECPADLAAEGVFCRMTVANEAVHVFAFSEAGDLPLVGLKSYDEDSFEIVLK